MLIRYGYKIAFSCPRPTPVVARLSVHPERNADVIYEIPFSTTPMVPSQLFTDEFGNRTRRFEAPAGTMTLRADGIISDSGLADAKDTNACEVPIMALPGEVMPFLLGSRYCETDLLSAIAWQMFAGLPPGWARVQAICDFVHAHLAFSYPAARSTRTAFEAYQERIGVCRDFTHLAITLCRCMNIPARYVNGYLGDIGIPADPAPMDFSAWFDVYLGDRWHTFDARHNKPRTGRIVISRGRDAMDVPMIHSFGPHVLQSFHVTTVEVTDITSTLEDDARSWQQIMPRLSLAAA